MIAVSITIVDETRGRVVEAAVSDTVAVTELIPHLVDAVPGEHWRLSGPGGVLRPEHCLGEAGVRPGERLTLSRTTFPAPPTDTVGELSADPPGAEGVRSAMVPAALVAAAGTVVLPPFASGELVWSPLGMTTRFRSFIEGTGDPAGGIATASTVLVLLLALATAAGSLHDRRFVPVAAVLGFGVGLQISVLTGCVLAAACVWRSGAVRVATVTLALVSSVGNWPGVGVLCAMVGLVASGQAALAVSGVPLPSIPATGLFTAADGTADPAADDAPDGSADTAGAADRARRTHSALVVVSCVVVIVGVLRLIPPGSHPGWVTLSGCLAVAATGVSARGCRPVHAVCVTLTATTVLVWTLVHGPGLWPLAALLPVLLPTVSLRSPLAERAVDVLESVAFAVSVPLLLATTGIFELVRGIG